MTSDGKPGLRYNEETQMYEAAGMEMLRVGWHGLRWDHVSGARLRDDDWLDIESLEPKDRIQLALKRVAERYGSPPSRSTA